MKSLISIAGVIALVASGFALNRPEAPAEPPPPVVEPEPAPVVAAVVPQQGDQPQQAPSGG